MTSTPTAYDLVVWRRSALGRLHAQWWDDWQRGESEATCHPDMGLAGEPEVHQAGACRDCERMARSLTTHADEEQYYTTRRTEVVEAARRRDTVTASWVAETWALSAAAAHQLLSRAERAGLLTRVGFGEYRARVAQ